MEKGYLKCLQQCLEEWHSWCLEREVDPFSAPLAFVLDFLAWMHFNGYEYRTINVHRPAVSSVLPYIDGLPFGQLPLVKQLLRGIIQKNHPLQGTNIHGILISY